MSMKCKKVLAVSVIFSLFMANIAYAANPKVEIAYRGSVEDGLEIEYDDGTVKYADDNAMLMMNKWGCFKCKYHHKKWNDTCSVAYYQ